MPRLSSAVLSRRRMLALSAAALGTASLRRTGADDGTLADGTVIVFQGDSITDVRRNRTLQAEPSNLAAMGTGYAHKIAKQLLAEYPDKQLQIYNRGISGNKVPQLDARWQADAIDLKPDLLSILIGVNDIWHMLGGRYDGTVETYRTGLAELLARTTRELPGVRLIVCEPFVLRTGVINDDWFPEFENRRQACEEVAREAGAVWVPFQQMFDQAVASGVAPGDLARDGVHPTPKGHEMMAEKWREVVGI